MSVFDSNFWYTFTGISPIKAELTTLDELSTLDELYTSIFNKVATEATDPSDATKTNLNLSKDFGCSLVTDSSSRDSSSRDSSSPKIKDIPITDLKRLESNINSNINSNIRYSSRIQNQKNIRSIIANKPEQDDYKTIEEIESNINSNISYSSRIANKPEQDDNTNKSVTPNTSLNKLITSDKTPLTDIIIKFIKNNTSHPLNSLNITDISPVYNKKLMDCFNKANITGIKIRDASCDFIKEEKQMTDIWGKDVTAHAKEYACCYLCNVQIVKRAPPEMEHKIVCPIVFTQFLHYNRLKKLYFTGDIMNTIFTLWSVFKDANQTNFQTLYILINCSSSNSYPKTVINTGFNDIFKEFKTHIIKSGIKITDRFNNEFLFYKSFIKFWLMEFAYAHHTCNQGKHYHSYNTSCGINDGTAQISKRSNSITDNKVTIENQEAGITQIVKGTKNRQTYLINHFKHIIECGKAVCDNYHYISNATSQIDAELATNIFIIKNLRRMYQTPLNRQAASNTKSQSNKSKTSNAKSNKRKTSNAKSQSQSKKKRKK